MEQRDLYELFVDLPVALLLVDRKGKIHTGSAVAASLLGLSHDQLSNTPLASFNQFSPQQIIDCLKPCTRSNKPVLTPLRLLNHETQQIISSKGCLFKKALSEKDGRALIVLHLDPHSALSSNLLELNNQINKQKMLITQLNLTNDELQRSNKELENFAYIASHDLRSPLRGIDQIATWLTEDLLGKIDDTNADHLHLMRGRIKRMERLLDDILIYSRAGEPAQHVAMTDVNQLVQEVFELLNVNHKYSLNIECSLPVAKFAHIPLQQVFRNLLNNAVKHHDQRVGQISVNYTELGQLHEFEVADDGPGIALEFSELVFTMFKTLRPRDEVEGSGMGLAIVKKIVESSGGTIKLLHNSPRGARFIFTWPKHATSTLA